jgi:Fe2+ or Zn2+ uptake regulation protein
MGGSEEPSIRQDILSYLLTHTAAQDTIEGIVDWWLVEERIKRRTKEVQKVLDQLVAEQLIIARKSKDSKTRYRINQRKLNRIREILKDQRGLN